MNSIRIHYNLYQSCTYYTNLTNYTRPECTPPFSHTQFLFICGTRVRDVIDLHTHRFRQRLYRAIFRQVFHATEFPPATSFQIPRDHPIHTPSQGINTAERNSNNKNAQYIPLGTLPQRDSNIANLMETGRYSHANSRSRICSIRHMYNII